MAYTTNTSRDRKRRADLTSSNIRRLIAVIDGITIVARLTAVGFFFTSCGLIFAFVLINWITGCGERFYHMDGTYTQGQCVTPLDLLNNHRDTQTPQEDNT
jgi:hypothetical protein